MNDTIKCRELIITDESGNSAITLTSDSGVHSINIGSNKEAAIRLWTTNGKPQMVFEREGRHEIIISCSEGISLISILDEDGTPSIKIINNKSLKLCSIDLYDKGQLKNRITI